jgi:hypothetical protein
VYIGVFGHRDGDVRVRDPSFARVTRPPSVAVFSRARESCDVAVIGALDAVSGAIASRDPRHHHSATSTAITSPSTPARRRTTASYNKESALE